MTDEQKKKVLSGEDLAKEEYEAPDIEANTPDDQVGSGFIFVPTVVVAAANVVAVANVTAVTNAVATTLAAVNTTVGANVNIAANVNTNTNTNTTSGK